MSGNRDLNRRGFLARGLAAASAALLGGCEESSDQQSAEATLGKDVTLFVCGDVMLGRGIDQILPFPSDPALDEPVASSAVDYVQLAESTNGPIPLPSSFDYVWGDALTDLDVTRPHARIVNLETSITTSMTPAPKVWNYKMSPGNVGCLKTAAVQCCVLANNHVLDWGVNGLLETVTTLEREGIAVAGAGADLNQAATPASISLSDRRVLVYGFGVTTSGIPREWAATSTSPGVSLLTDLSRRTAAKVARRIAAARRPDDLVVVSIHWGSNWGYRVDNKQRAFAHALIDAGACDLLHGHSSHHPRGIEIYRDRPILYGCGDFINDYEGIGMKNEDYKEYRGDLSVAYLARLKGDGALSKLALVPYQIRRFRLHRASEADAMWLQSTLDRESVRFGTRIVLENDQLTALPQ
jgi:poly-gamma-glutamate capsule biosynthesis protein CapA/YwtB (metallophosphatase superfamily)